MSLDSMQKSERHDMPEHTFDLSRYTEMADIKNTVVEGIKRLKPLGRKTQRVAFTWEQGAMYGGVQRMEEFVQGLVNDVLANNPDKEKFRVYLSDDNSSLIVACSR